MLCKIQSLWRGHVMRRRWEGRLALMRADQRRKALIHTLADAAVANVLAAAKAAHKKAVARKRLLKVRRGSIFAV